MYGVILIAVLAIMGGLIAYIGDKLGTKVGKRKLTIFGLRPKHTSILVTIITGIMIATATLGVLALVSKDVRMALFGMEALKAELVSLTKEVSVKNSELDISRAQFDAKNEEYKALTVKINNTMTELSKVSLELAAVTSERDRTLTELERVQGRLDKSQRDIEALQATKTELDMRVASLNESKGKLQNDVDNLSVLTTNLKKNIEVMRVGKMIYRAGEILSTAAIKGGQSRSDTKQALVDIINTTNHYMVNNLGLKDKNVQVLLINPNQVEQAAAAIAGSKEDVVIRISSLGNMVYGEHVIGQIDLFPKRLIYSAGQVVHSQVFDAADDSEQAQGILVMFLHNVNLQATSKGVMPDPLQGSVGSISASKVFDIINKIKKQSGKFELTATAKDDMYNAGPLQIEIKVRSLWQ
ncbi:MAG: hypothetical protein H6Q73_1761 [Firmicutes bacterium]|nr:hypothetical protein [Bacillota bacterium]